jgi:hypothetical protein
MLNEVGFPVPVVILAVIAAVVVLALVVLETLRIVLDADGGDLRLVPEEQEEPPLKA